MLPFSSLGERLDDIVKYTAIYAVVFLMMMMSVISAPAPFDVMMKVPFLTIMIYYWAAFRPTIIPPLIAFLIGLLYDILSGAPAGLHAMLFVLIQWAISDQRAFLSAQSFLLLWLVFSILHAVTVFLQWLIFGLVDINWVNISMVLPDIFVGVVAFPFLFWIWHGLHGLLPKLSPSLR